MGLLIKNVELDGKETDVLIEGNRFKAIGADLNAPESDFLEGQGMAVVPTFVNGHTHASMTLMRSYADDLELHDWLTNYIWPLESKLGEEDIYHGARLACLEMIKSGTTCFNDMYWHFHGVARAVEEMGLRAVLSSVFIDFSDEAKAAEQRELTMRLFEESKRYSDRIGFALGPHAIYTVSESSLRWIKSFADEHGLLIHIHISETEKEVEDCVALCGLRPVEWLQKIGFLGCNIVAAHAIHVTDKEIHLLAKNGVKVVHNPVSNMKLASGSFSYARMREHGVEVSLGTDGCSSNNNLCMLEEMKMAALHAKLVHNDPTVLSAREAFNMATLEGAKALRLDCGEIAEGKLADCMLVDLSNHRLAPGYQLIDDLVYSADTSCIDTVICDGRILMQNGCVEGEEEIVAEARRYATTFQ
ncbi:amidohydrolase [Pontiella sulfatireligans]|uniref:5-methylthioadenosine/S-adenosylhomocysteine deaminase n=1 Tax=Pontiella sulfatireligans TaxID=2750658 RepID=A0A6C2UCX3_9BACT|nr:amidohydrolase [Pontiella sulfatireligans]VGO18042.1 5-methylthioadenosine/S-adenosylhomocysteine deaminase [Pontiella sulfatireligans]